MKILPTLLYAASALAVCALGVSTSAASTEKLLYSFPYGGGDPMGRLDQDSKGVLYGTAEMLGGYGGIYRLKQKNGEWHENTLFEFDDADGAYPQAGPLIDRATSILYGTTVDEEGYGKVYSLAPKGRGWTETVLHSFSFSDGEAPYAGLLKDKTTGDLFGTTTVGGSYSCGTAFQLHGSNGTWTFNTIYMFGNDESDACNPYTQLRHGPKAGTLIGAAIKDYGQIFELKENHGIWSDSIIYRFTGGIDGGYPNDIDASNDGSIYGVTAAGGQYGDGVVFKLTPNLRRYVYSVIYNFRGGRDGSDGIGINLDAATGNLYGTTFRGGTADDGTVFKLSPNADAWTERVLHSFTGSPNDGANPASRPVVDRITGALYGTTLDGGTNNGGTLYMVQP